VQAAGELEWGPRARPAAAPGAPLLDGQSAWLAGWQLQRQASAPAAAPLPLPPCTPAVGYALLEKALLKDKHTYYSVGAVGFSGVVFALKVAAGARWAGGRCCRALTPPTPPHPTPPPSTPLHTGPLVARALTPSRAPAAAAAAAGALASRPP
jgi:hypothetical protein